MIQELKKAILEDMVRLGKEGGLHSFEQVTVTFSILVMVLYVGMKIKVTDGDANLDSPSSTLWPAGSLCNQQTSEDLFQADFATTCNLAKRGHMLSETALTVLRIINIHKAEIFS